MKIGEFLRKCNKEEIPFYLIQEQVVDIKFLVQNVNFLSKISLEFGNVPLCFYRLVKENLEIG